MESYNEKTIEDLNKKIDSLGISITIIGISFIAYMSLDIIKTLFF